MKAVDIKAWKVICLVQKMIVVISERSVDSKITEVIDQNASNDSYPSMRLEFYAR